MSRRTTHHDEVAGRGRLLIPWPRRQTWRSSLPMVLFFLSRFLSKQRMYQSQELFRLYLTRHYLDLGLNNFGLAGQPNFIQNSGRNKVKKWPCFGFRLAKFRTFQAIIRRKKTQNTQKSNYGSHPLILPFGYHTFLIFY